MFLIAFLFLNIKMMMINKIIKESIEKALTEESLYSASDIDNIEDIIPMTVDRRISDAFLYFIAISKPPIDKANNPMLIPLYR